MKLQAFPDDARQADRFLADLLGEPMRRAPAESIGDAPWSDARPEPFFGDGPADAWTVLGEPGAAVVGLRDHDLVVRRLRADGRVIFRARLASQARLRPGGPTGRRWIVPPDTIVLRRVRRRMPLPPPADWPLLEQAVPQQQPYLPTGGRAFVPQAGTFNCGPAGFTVVPASFLPQATTNADAAIDAALTAAGLSVAQRALVTRDGLRPIAAEFGASAFTELIARLRWSAADIARREWGQGADSMLVQRLLIHVPGHFRELARRAPDAREAFVLECLGWLVLTRLRRAVDAATRRNWWVPPAPAFVTAVPNPIPPLSPAVRALVQRWLLIDTTLAINTWNDKLLSWGTGLAGRQWQAEVRGTAPGRPFYASLATIPAHRATAAAKALFRPAWDRRLADVDAANTPHAAGATAVTLAGLRNAVALRTCLTGAIPLLPAGALASVSLQGLTLAYQFPHQTPRLVTQLDLLGAIQPIYEAVFRTIYELGWNDLLYQTSGGGCFRGTKHPGTGRATVGGRTVTIDAFDAPTATTVTQVNTEFTAAQRAGVLAAAQTARRISDHATGSAIDVNVQENGQGLAARRHGSMDPRIVAVFEAFHFQSGSCFAPSDPMHFEYCDRPCAPAAAATGALGPVVPRTLLLPLAAGTALA
jgi:hypothetical protein